MKSRFYIFLGARGGTVMLPVLFLLSALAFPAAAQTYPPSCVVTMPHSNAYFKVNTTIEIMVYATDIGKTASNGTVAKVEFYSGTTKLGEATTHTNYTYTYSWCCSTAGSYTITAVATNSSGVTFTSAGVLITVGASDVTERGMSACKGKYLANIIASSVNSDYMTYWNGVSAENACKWGSVESTRDVMSWTTADVSYNYATANNLMFRYHVIAWGSQYPSWITSLSTTDFKAEIEEYMAAVAARYPYMDQIDVLNEQIGSHASGTSYFINGMGGTGTTGYDWQIWLFTKARQYFPNTKLILNDYGLENDQSAINTQLGLIKALRDRGLVDGFGTQAHCFNIDALTASALETSLDLMTTGGVPIYVTELDLNGGTESTSNEAVQKTSYQTHFPVYWEHPAVAGITLWGYVDGSTWKTGTGLLTSSMVEKSAMTWLKSYVSGLTDAGYPYCQAAACTVNTTDPVVSITSPTSASTFTSPATVTLEAAASDPDGTVASVSFYNGTTLLGTVTSSSFQYTWTNVAAGTYTITAVATDNSGNQTTSSALTVTVTAPALTGTIVVRAVGTAGSEIINLEIDGTVIQTWTLTTAYADYTATGNVNGTIRINYTNDATGLDAQVDYIIVADSTYQAEDQSINTAYYANGACGGGSNSEMMHCTGYIEFATAAVTDQCPGDPDKIAPGSCGCGVADTDTDGDGTADCLDTDDDADGAPDAGDCDSLDATVGAKTTYYADADGDGKGDPATTQAACSQPTGYVTDSTDECPADASKADAGLCGCGVVEGTCSSVTLKAGWNLVGCPLTGSTALASALSSIWSQVLTVKNLDAFYSVDNSAAMNSLTQVEWGRGYYVKVKAACTLDWIAR